MQPANSHAIVSYHYVGGVDGDEERIMDIETSVRAVEKLLNYRFNNKSLLQEALTHSSYTDAPNYQRLEFIGDAALGLAVSNFFYSAYPDLDPGELSLLRSANICTEKLARVAVRHKLYRYVRHNAAALNGKVRDFVIAVEQEDETAVYGGTMKAPKVLADIVESVAAAVYVDCDFNLETLWLIFQSILEPIVMLDVLVEQPQPVTTLFEVCQKEGKQVDINYWRKGEKYIATVFVDGKFVVSSSSWQKENAKLHAAEAALQKLSFPKTNGRMAMDICGELNGANEIDGEKQKLLELCGKKRWPKPTYRIEKEVGPSHERKFICLNQKSRVKESAASMMLLGMAPNDGDRANWEDPELFKLFIDLSLKESSEKGYSGSSLKKESWNKMRCILKEKKGIVFNQKQLKKQWEYLKNKYAAWAKLINKTGNMYNPVTNTVTMSSEEWDDYVQANPLAKQFRYSGLQYHEELRTLFDGLVATGKAAWGPAMKGLPTDGLGSSSQIPVDLESEPLDTPTEPIEESKLNVKRRRREKFEDLNGYLVLEESEGPNVNECNKILDETLEVTDPLYIVACSIFCQGKAYKEQWVMLSQKTKEVRRQWIELNGKKMGYL